METAVQNLITSSAVHNAVLTPVGSKILLRKVISSSIASILHSRTNTNRTAFINSLYNNQLYQRFNYRTDVEDVRQVIAWIKGLYDALNKNYLREIYLFFTDKQKGCILESYKFILEYLDRNNGDRKDANDLTKSITDLFKLIQDMNRNGKILEEGKFTVYICVTYHENAPSSYRPIHFVKPEDDIGPIINYIEFQSVETILKTLTSGFHTLKFAATHHAVNNIKNEDHGKHVPKKQKHITAQVNINCKCGISTPFPSIALVSCSKCTDTAHAPCLGYLHMQDDSYICTNCSVESVLITPSTPGNLWREQGWCVYRLTVSYVYFNMKSPFDVLSETSQQIRSHVRSKLEQLDVIQKTDDRYTINQEKLNIVIQKLFFTNLN